MKKGDTVKVVASSHSDVPTGCVGVIKSALAGGFGVTIKADFFIPGVVPYRRDEIRTVWFSANDLESFAPDASSSTRNESVACEIEIDMFGAQGCASCDQALVRAGS